MKFWSIAGLFLLNTMLSVTSFADEAEVRPLLDEPTSSELSLPTEEKAFVEAINKFDKKTIVELLGEPAKADDVRLKGSDKIVASIWHYHHINTAEDGTYYQTTELDFIDDKVVQVVFLNNDGSETAAQNQTYQVPAPEPQ
ncbi:MAG: hypothetical protein ACT4OH_05930 [Methylophilaceae bacterium]